MPEDPVLFALRTRSRVLVVLMGVCDMAPPCESFRSRVKWAVLAHAVLVVTAPAWPPPTGRGHASRRRRHG